MSNPIKTSRQAACKKARSALFALITAVIFASAHANIADKVYVDRMVNSLGSAATKNVGTANGVAMLDENIKIPYAQIPVGTAENTIAAGNDSRIIGAEQISNKVSSISASSTDTQYPTAKLMWNTLGSIQSALNLIANGT